MNTRRELLKGAAVGAATALIGNELLKSSYAQSSPTQPTRNNPLTLDSPIVQDGVAPDGTIDWHNHWISPGVVPLLQKHDDANPDANSAYSSATAGSGLPSPSAPSSGSNFLIPIDERIDHLNKAGVSRQVISWPTTLGWDAVLTPDEAKPIWSTFNNELSDLVKNHPDKFSGYSIVPTSDIDWAVAEAERGFRDLGLIGVTLPVGGFQTLEGAKHLEPIVDVINRHNGILYLHTGPAYHTIPGQRTSDIDPDGSATGHGRLAAPATFARGAVTLSQTDYLKPYPNVAAQIGMLGGLTSFLFALSKLNPSQDGGDDPIQKLRRVYLDASTSRVTGTLELAVQTIGADRVLFGTDYGAGNRVDPVVAAVHGAQLTDDEKTQVFVTTGQTLFAEKGKAS